MTKKNKKHRSFLKKSLIFLIILGTDSTAFQPAVAETIISDSGKVRAELSYQEEDYKYSNTH